jgi:hypothetical protein
VNRRAAAKLSNSSTARNSSRKRLWKFFVVVGYVLGAEMVQVRFAENDEMVEALALDQLDESFDIGAGVGRADGILDRAHPLGFEFCIERLGELGVVISSSACRTTIAGTFSNLANHTAAIILGQATSGRRDGR